MKNGLNSLMRSGGFEARTLETDNGRGFVVRVADLSHTPPRVDTVAMQPGQDSISISTLAVRVEKHPESDLPLRLRGLGEIDPTPAKDLVATLEPSSNALAQLAVQHLSEA